MKLIYHNFNSWIVGSLLLISLLTAQRGYTLSPSNFCRREAVFTCTDEIVFLKNGGADFSAIIRLPPSGYYRLDLVDRKRSFTYSESFTSEFWMHPWLDLSDVQRVGDYMGLGHPQVLYINRQDAGNGKITIIDYYSGHAETKYYEKWGDNNLLNGWLDAGDVQLDGDFLGLGHSQVMFINRKNEHNGKVLIVDYSLGHPEVKYWESWGDNDCLSGWLDDGDIQLAGDFKKLGHDQVMYINRQDHGGGKIMIMDYRTLPLSPIYWENWGDNHTLDHVFSGVVDVHANLWGRGYDGVIFSSSWYSDGTWKLIDFSTGTPIVADSNP